MNNKERYDCDLTSTKGKRQVVLAEYTVLASSVQILSTKDSLYMKTLSEISDQLLIWNRKGIRFTRQRICIIS